MWSPCSSKLPDSHRCERLARSHHGFLGGIGFSLLILFTSQSVDLLVTGSPTIEDMDIPLVIGQLAQQTGVTAKTIRYYEETGLLPTAARAANGYRMYGERAVHLLRFVKRARDLGFTIEEVGSLLALWGDDERASADVKELATRHLEEIEDKIRKLKNLRKTMRTLIDSCHGDERADCPILDDLAKF